MAGRKPKPTHLKLITGNPGRRKINQREPKPKGDLTDPPDYFNKAERDAWQYAIDNAPAGLLKRLDLAVLETWVVALVTYREAVRHVRNSGQVIKQNGQIAVNPFLHIQNKQALIMLKAAGEMGFTPSSRTRIQLDNDASEEEGAGYYD